MGPYIAAITSFVPQRIRHEPSATGTTPNSIEIGLTSPAFLPSLRMPLASIISTSPYPIMLHLLVSLPLLQQLVNGVDFELLMSH